MISCPIHLHADTLEGKGAWMLRGRPKYRPHRLVAAVGRSGFKFQAFLKATTFEAVAVFFLAGDLGPRALLPPAFTPPLRRRLGGLRARGSPGREL